MRKLVTTLLSLTIIAFFAVPAFAQEEGDYRTTASGDWSDPQIWESYNGSSWGAIAEAPSGSETITVVGTEERTDSVFVDVELSISGTLINQGILEAADEDSLLTFADGGVYEHARDEGEIPTSTWEEGSTLLLTGTYATAPENRRQNYHNIIFDTPELASNLNMDLDSVTVSGDILVRNTNIGRWYLTSAEVEEGSTVTIMGDVTVEDGAFAVQGTSNPYTDFVVHHYGDIEVTGGNFSISRGSQPGGATKWYLHEGNFSMDNATTQSSTAEADSAFFVFAGDDTQTLTLGENVDFSSLPIKVSSGATVDMGSSTLSGNGRFVVEEGGAIATALPGGVEEIVAGFEDPATLATLEDNSSYIFNGTEEQVTSETMPAVVEDMTIDNEAGVTLSQEITLNGVLTLAAGLFDNTAGITFGEDAVVELEGGSAVDEEGLPVGSESVTSVPESFFVGQNYPNPFNSSTAIRYGLPSPSEVTVTVYDMLGQRVVTLVEGTRGAGVHEVTLDAGDLSSGMYIYRVQAGEYSTTKRMVLIE